MKPEDKTPSTRSFKAIAIFLGIFAVLAILILVVFPMVFRNKAPELAALKLTVTDQGWTGWTVEQPEPKVTVYDDIQVGTELHTGITIKSVKKNSVVISLEGTRVGFVEPNDDGTISLKKERLKTLEIKCGEEKEVVSQTMDGGTHLYFKLEKNDEKK